jgi:hypothetical protein
MDRDPRQNVKTTTCPTCNAEIEIPLRATDAEGNYSSECTTGRGVQEEEYGSYVS